MSESPLWCMIGDRPWASTGRIATRTPCAASPIWKRLSNLGVGARCRNPHARSSRRCDLQQGNRWSWNKTPSSRSNLPNTILRRLTEEEMAHYRRPFAEPGEARRPTLSWPRQLPFDGEPANVTEIVTTYGKWLAQSPIPKLYIQSD